MTVTYSPDVAGGGYYSSVTQSYYKTEAGAQSAEAAYNVANTNPNVIVAQTVTTQPQTPTGGISTKPPPPPPTPTGGSQDPDSTNYNVPVTPPTQVTPGGTVIVPTTPPPIVEEPTPVTGSTGLAGGSPDAQNDYGGETPTYTVTTPDGETETFDDYMDAQNYAVENSPIAVTTVDSEGNEAIQTFTDADDAERYVERLDQNTMVAGTQGIPGPGLGPRPGSTGADISTYLTGGLQTIENNFENVAQYIRQISSESWTRAAEAKNANDVFGTITGGSLAVSERILAGLYEGATFIVRPAQWGQLAATPVLVASNPTGYAKAVQQDLGGLVLEGVGAFAGGYFAGKSINYGIDLAKGVYNRSEFAQLQKLHPIDADTPIDWSSNERFGQLRETSYSANDPLQRLRGRWSSKSMYSSLVPVMDIDRIILNPKLILRVDPAALGAVTSLATINRVSVKPTLQSIDVQTLPVRVTPGAVAPSVRTVTRQDTQIDTLTIVPITRLIDETFIPQDEAVGVETKSGVVIIPEQVVDVTPVSDVEQPQDVVVDETPIQDQIEDVVVEPVVMPVQKGKQSPRLMTRRSKDSRREETRRRVEGSPIFTVRMRYGRKSVTRSVDARTFREALAKVLKGSPSEVEVRRRG